jgi:hypothetical protein
LVFLASALSTSSTVSRGVVLVLTRPEPDTANESEEAAILSGRNRDDDHVVLSETKVGGFNLAAERLDGAGDRCPPSRCFVFLEALETLSRVRRLYEVLGRD